MSIGIVRTGYNQDYLCSFLDFSMRELDGLKVWVGFGSFSFTFNLADSEHSVLREALKSNFIFPSHTYVPYDKDTSWVFFPIPYF